MTPDPNRVAEIAAGLTKACRRCEWLRLICDAGPSGLDNTPVPWVHLARLRNDGLCSPVFRDGLYYEVATPLGIALRDHLLSEEPKV